MKKKNVSAIIDTPDSGRGQPSSCSEITVPEVESFRGIAHACAVALNEELSNPQNAASRGAFERLRSGLKELLRTGEVLAESVESHAKVKAVMKSMPCDVDGMLNVLIEEMTALRINPDAGRSFAAVRETVKLMIDVQKLKIAGLAAGIILGRPTETPESHSKESRE